MDWWYARLEQRRSSIIFAVNLIAIGTLVVTAMRTFAGYDVYWHLQMGKDWIENGLSPWVDHYSFTYPGAEIVGPPILFQVVVSKLVGMLGEFGGFFVVRLSAFLLALVMMSLWLRQIRAPVLAYCIVIPLLTVLLQARAIVRPELFSYSLIILSLMLYQRSRLELSVRSMWPIVIVLLFWTNYHSSILAYVIFFGLFVDCAYRLSRQSAPIPAWLAWGAWGLVMIGVGFLNLNFSHALLQFATFSSEWNQLIQEYGAPTRQLGIPAIYVLILVSILTVFMLAKQRKIGFLAISLIFIYAGLTMMRMVTPAGIVVLCLFSYALSNADLEALLKQASPAVRTSVAGFALIMFLVPMLNSVLFARNFMKENREPFAKMPYDLTEHMVTNQISGRIYNAYEVGGYLIYRMSRDSQIYIDGRTAILYPVDHYLRQVAAERFPEVLRGEVQKYGIEFAVLRSSASKAALMDEVGFQLEFVDYQYALYSREEGVFKSTGKFWANPACWNPDLAASLESEWLQARLLLPPNVVVMPLLVAANEYGTATDVSEFLKKAAANVWLPDSTRRFLGYRALDAGLFDYAISQFRRIRDKDKDANDYLAEGLALLRAGKPADAEHLLSQATLINWPHLDFKSVLILHALLYEISQKHRIELFDAKYLNDLESRVGNSSLPTRGETVTVSAFCGA